MSTPESASRFPTFARIGATLVGAERRVSSSPWMKRFGTWFNRFLERPPARIFHVFVAIVCLGAMYWASFPGGNGILAFVIIGATAQLLVGIWLFRFVGATAIKGKTILARDSWPWLIAPVLFSVTLGSVLFSLPLRARFQLSQDAMTTFAQDVIEEGSFVKPGYVGLWPVGRVRGTDEGMRFLVRGAVFLDEYGFAYSRNGLPRRIGEDTFVHLEGPWYLWEKSW